MIHRLLAVGTAVTLAACSPAADHGTDSASPTPAPTASSTPTPAPTTAPPTPVSMAAARPGQFKGPILGLEGLGALRIGQPVPAGSGWAERPGQMAGPCRIILSPDYVGVYAIVENGKVARITISATSNVKLAEGITHGSPEREVRQWFGGFREEPHNYEPAPAKYLTAPNAASGDPALRFEIDRTGRVSDVHVGTMPVLGYVEGCA